MTKTKQKFHIVKLEQMPFFLEEKNGKSYWMVHYPKHRYARQNGYVYYHRLLLENELERYLEPDERVWFEDGNTLNTEVSNLRLVSVSEHRSLASKSQAFLEPIECSMCGVKFQPPESETRYCSQRCAHWALERTDWPPPDVLAKIVWRMPTVEVAMRLGVSDKAVEKRCKKFGIPKPPRGYWQKRYAGKPTFEPRIELQNIDKRSMNGQ